MLSYAIELGPLMADDAVSDTGPILHLQEIGHLAVVGNFDRLIPELVVQELRAHGLALAQRLANLP